MKVEQNNISRDWVIMYKWRRFLVNFKENDSQTLCSRDNWKISELMDKGIGELNAINTRQPVERVDEKLVEKLIVVCISNWDNEFMHDIQDDLWAKQADLGCLTIDRVMQ